MTVNGGSVVEVLGVYNADGGLLGEMRYVVGHLLGRVECQALRHHPLTDAPQVGWDLLVSRFPLPLRVVHRNGSLPVNLACVRLAFLRCMPSARPVRTETCSVLTTLPAWTGRWRPSSGCCSSGGCRSVGQAPRSPSDTQARGLRRIPCAAATATARRFFCLPMPCSVFRRSGPLLRIRAQWRSAPDPEAVALCSGFRTRWPFCSGLDAVALCSGFRRSGALLRISTREAPASGYGSTA